jgi:hypothetical protein
MVVTLIDHLARGIAILDFGDCKGGHLALRELCPTGLVRRTTAATAKPADISFVNLHGGVSLLAMWLRLPFAIMFNNRIVGFCVWH